MTRRFSLVTPVILLLLAASSRPTATGGRIEKTLALEPGGRFVLSSPAGSVSVTGSSTPGAHIVVTSDKGDVSSRYGFRFEEQKGIARVTVQRKLTGLLGWLRKSSMHFKVMVPTDTELEIRTRGGALDFKAVKGDILGNTSGGPITIAQAGGRVDARTSRGSVLVSFAQGNSRGGRIETAEGSIQVAVDPAANLSIEATTNAGAITNSIPLAALTEKSRKQLLGRLGKGGEMLTIHTSGGSILIEPI